MIKNLLINGIFNNFIKEKKVISSDPPYKDDNA